MPDDNHPYPQYHLIDDPDTDANTYRFRDYVVDHEPSEIRALPGELNPVADIRSDKVPMPVQIRTPAMIHYPKARDVIIVNSGVNINEQKLGFDARAIVVQNIGANRFLYSPELNMYLTAGRTPLVTYNLPSSIEKISLIWHTAPFNVATPAAQAGQFALVWLYDEWVPPDVGIGDQVSLAATSGGLLFPLGGVTPAFDAIAPDTSLDVASFLLAWNGAAFDRIRLNSAADLAAATQQFSLMVANPGEWSQMSAPAANTLAITTRAAVAGQRHVVRSINATLSGGAVAPAPIVLGVQLVDGVTVIWGQNLAIQGVAGANSVINVTGLNIVGSVNANMTLQFSLAPGANAFESVAMTGYTTV